MRNKIFYLVSSGFVLGVLLRSFFDFDSSSIFIIGLAYILGILFSSTILKWFKVAHHPRNWDIFISVFVIAFLLGILRFHVADISPPKVFEAYVDQNISVSGVIVEEPDESETDIKLILGTTVEGSEAGIVIFTKPDQSTQTNNTYRYGDEILVSGKLEKPKNFMTDQGLEFDYVNYLRKDGIFYTMRNPQIKILSSGNGNFIKHILFPVKERFNTALVTSIPAPESTLLRGIILGENYAFSQQLRQSFMDTGTIHVVTIGGYHVTLVAQWIMKILGFLPQFAGIGAGIISIFLYVIMTGGAQTAIRAGIMATLVLVAQATGREYMAGRALIFAATFMILLNPFVLAYDVSFELSFMATIAIIFLSPRLETYFKWIRWKWLRDITTITSAMYVFVLPLILYRIGSLSLVALPANILIIPLMPATMIAGFITGFAGLISPILVFIPGTFTYTLLYYHIAVTGILANLKFAALNIQDFPFIIVVLIYVMFFWIFFSKLNQKETMRFFLLITPLLITLAVSGLLYYRHFEANRMSQRQLQALLVEAPAIEPSRSFQAEPRTKSNNCEIKDHLPDLACTPGAIFTNATVEQICVKGYTKTVRNVSTKLRKQVFAEYGISYPQPRGAYEVDHFIPLALAGSNDIANLFPEAAEPAPGFHEKDVVEVYLQREVCSGRVTLSVAQRQIATDWLAVYNNLTNEEILAIKKKYGRNANQ